MTSPISPNYDDRPEGTKIDVLVMHYTGMKTAIEALDRLCDPVAKVSSHYFVYEDGQIVQLVKENKRAWHAGISCWRGISSLNDTSIGIEIVNPGHEWGYVPFEEDQITSVINLARDIIQRHQIPPRNVVGHSDIAPSRKQDPGELFPWKQLASEGVGLWPDVRRVWRGEDGVVEPGKEGVDVAQVQKMLADFGYHIRVDGYYGPKTEDIIRAFKRHFVPEQLNVRWDKLTNERMKWLMAAVAERE